MRFWLDTEFYEDGRTIELISIGIVAEDGREFYAETIAARIRAGYTPWLRENVQPHVRGPSGAMVRADAALGAEVVKFIGDETPEFWAYYADYDWVVLCQLFGRMIDLPKGWPMFCLDLRQSMHERGISRDALPPNPGEHDALADARWTRDAWMQVYAAKAPEA